MLEKETIILAIYKGETKIQEWKIEEGLRFLYDEEEENGFYKANFNTRDFDLEVGELMIKVMDEDHKVLGSIVIMMDSPQRGRR